MSYQKSTVTISLDQMGVGSIKIGDLDISNFSQGFTIQAKAGQPTKIAIDLAPLPISASIVADLNKIGVKVNKLTEETEGFTYERAENHPDLHAPI